MTPQREVRGLKGLLHNPEVMEVLRQANWRKTSEGLDSIVSDYLIGEPVGIWEADILLGCICFSINGSGEAEVTNLIVHSQHRRKGVGRWLVRESIRLLGLSLVAAETDKDAVGFYRRMGFEVESLGEKYPGVERFKCIWRLHHNSAAQPPNR